MAGRTRSAADERVLEAIFNPENPMGVIEVPDEEIMNGEPEDTEEVKRARELEVQAVRAAEDGNLSHALELLNRAVVEAPAYASPYNNRAWVYQLQHRVDLAAVDLDKAIELSSGRGRAAENAFTQRGIIWKLRGNNERALEDFEKAARLGNQFAKRQVVHMNPYAAICNEAIDKMMSGEYS